MDELLTYGLNQCESNCVNLSALKTLAISDVNYVFIVGEAAHDGLIFKTGNSDAQSFTHGVTEMPGAECNPSPDENVYIFVGSILDEKQQVLTTAHEAYAHAFLYDETRDYEAASHSYGYSVGQGEWIEEYGKHEIIFTLVDKNQTLVNRIKQVTKQAEINYNDRIRKQSH